ncbi:MAG: c-type cytochrome [Pseudomonadota bacterium]
MRLCFAISLPITLVASISAAENVVAYTISDGQRIEVPLTRKTGDWQRGRDLFFDRSLTGCSSCHGSPGGPGAEIAAENRNAPDLSGIAGRMSEGEIRLWIVAPVVLKPETEMPGFYLAGQRTDADSPVINGPWLNANQIEDIVAYLTHQTASQ